MVALGSVQRLAATIKDSRITYDHYAGTNIDTMGVRPGVINIMEIYNHENFSWSPSYIKERFALARKYAPKVKYLEFLMEEEIVQPSYSSWYGTWGGNNLRDHVGYTGSGSTVIVDPPTGASVNWGALSEEFYLQMLTAWITMIRSLPTNNEACLVMDMQSPPSELLSAIGPSGVNYIAKNFGMIWVYGFPASASDAACGKMQNGQNFPCAKSKIDFWRGKGFTGLIFHLITPGYGSDAAVTADFKNGADNGADIEGCYQYKSISNNDNLATARMLSIAAAYVPPTGTTRYKCSGAPNYQCTVDPTGQYTSLAACQAACQATAVYHKACVGGICKLVVGSGNDECQTVEQPCPTTSHNECIGGICTKVLGTGTNECTTEGAICCTPNPQCENPLNGYMNDGCGNRWQDAACNSAGNGLFSVTTYPVSGARIYLDNADSGAITPVILSVPSGSHFIRISLTGYQDITDTISLNPGGSIMKTYTLVPTTTNAGISGGTIAILALGVAALGILTKR